MVFFWFSEFDVHKKQFLSKLISRNVKLQLYNTLIRPTVKYASETWVPKENITNELIFLKERTRGKYLVLQEQMMASGGLKLIKK